MSSPDGSGLITLPVVGDTVIEGIVGVGAAEKSLDREEHGADLEGWRPLVLEDVEADTAELVDVGVVDLRQETGLGRRHGIVVWQKHLERELAILVRGCDGSVNDDVEVTKVVGIGGDGNTRCLLGDKTLCFFEDAVGDGHLASCSLVKTKKMKERKEQRQQRTKKISAWKKKKKKKNKGVTKTRRKEKTRKHQEKIIKR